MIRSFFIRSLDGVAVDIPSFHYVERTVLVFFQAKEMSDKKSVMPTEVISFVFQKKMASAICHRSGCDNRNHFDRRIVLFSRTSRTSRTEMATN